MLGRWNEYIDDEDDEDDEDEEPVMGVDMADRGRGEGLAADLVDREADRGFLLDPGVFPDAAPASKRLTFCLLREEDLPLGFTTGGPSYSELESLSDASCANPGGAGPLTPWTPASDLEDSDLEDSDSEDSDSEDSDSEDSGLGLCL